MDKKYDVIIIGAGMSGLAAGIRSAMFDKKVIILEKHSVVGGLNSYYKRGKRNFDVGLHALTNFIKKGERGRPFSKLLKQLRISYDDFKLHPQSNSKIIFPQNQLTFTNDVNFLIEEINREFPASIDNFLKLIDEVNSFNELDLTRKYMSAKEVLVSILKDRKLVDMILCPLLIYGSAWEDDMDFSQFVIMFKSIFIEGFSRPEGGVRTIIDMLVNRFKQLGGELLLKAPVAKIVANRGTVQQVVLQNGQVIQADKILSSAGLPETIKLVDGSDVDYTPRSGRLSFVETICVLDQKIPRELFDSTVLFCNEREQYKYSRSLDLFDPHGAVICCPDNYIGNETESVEGTIRVTNIANYDLWKSLSKDQYLHSKEMVFANALRMIERYVGKFDSKVLFKDVFTPTTIERYTGHVDGTVYGSIDKSRDGTTPINGLYVCGTDQGFLGIIGAMLSGISMANLHILMEN